MFFLTTFWPIVPLMSTHHFLALSSFGGEQGYSNKIFKGPVKPKIPINIKFIAYKGLDVQLTCLVTF